jgi:hypothetical protein
MYNVRQGNGTMKYNNGVEDEYIGQWYNHARFFSDTMTYKNGDKYEGKWYYNLKEGQGIMKYNNGDKYEGDWKKDKRNGQGTIKYANGNPSYTGPWSNDRISTEEDIENELQRRAEYENMMARDYTSDSDSDNSDDDCDSDEPTSTPIGNIKTNNFEKYIPKAHDPLNPYGPDPLIEIMNENPNLIAFKCEGKSEIHTIERESLRKLVDIDNSNNSVFYECLEIDPRFNIWERKENVVKKHPLFNLRSMMIHNGGYIRYEFILDAINGTNRYFLLYEPKKRVLKSLVSDSVLKTGNTVSASHCQEGIEGRLFEMKYIKDFEFKATKIKKTYRRYKNKKGGNKRKKSVNKKTIRTYIPR